MDLNFGVNSIGTQCILESRPTMHRICSLNKLPRSWRPWRTAWSSPAFRVVWVKYGEFGFGHLWASSVFIWSFSKFV